MSDHDDDQQSTQQQQQQSTQQQQNHDEMFLNHEISRAAKLIQNAKHIIFTAGAGLGIDSGLPAFRTKHGLWSEYPIFEKIGITNLRDMSNPEWFEKDPTLAWGFWSHRASMYRTTKPHAGFDLMLKWAKDISSNNNKNKNNNNSLNQENCFVFTSNVDGQFQKAGFEDARVHACHGEVTMLQCTDGDCARKHGPFPWPEEFRTRDPIIDFDASTLRVKDFEKDAPKCSHCSSLARPNVMMFCDYTYSEKHQATKMENLGVFMSKTTPRETVIVEIGCGTAIPTVRHFSESLAKRGCALIRINPDEVHFPSNLERDPETTLIGLPLGGLDGLTRIDNALKMVAGSNEEGEKKQD